MIGRQKKKEKEKRLLSFRIIIIICCVCQRERKSLANERYVCIREIHTSYSTPSGSDRHLYCSVPSTK